MNNHLIDLLTEFDEMGFAPTTVCPNPEEYAIGWRVRITKEIEAIQAENAELKSRLEKAVELPCKVGGTVFAIIGHRECVEVFKVTSIEIFKSIIYVRLAGFFKMSLPLTEYGKRFFTDLEAAEARLKELRGGYGNVDNGG